MIHRIARRFTAFAAGLVVLAASAASAHTIGSNFDCAVFGAELLLPGLSRAAAPTTDARILSVASKFPVIPGRDGRTILPVGTVIDTAALEDGWLVVRATFPATVAPASLDRITVYQGSEILRHFFGESDKVLGSKLLARIAGETDYRDIEYYLATEAPILRARAVASQQDWFEPNGPGPSPDPDYEAWWAKLRAEQAAKIGTDNIAGQASTSTSGMPTGALAGRIIFTYGGHGRTWDGSLNTWRWQRGYTNSMMEDFGNADGSDAYAYYCFNAGATVVSFRPIGYQNNEVVLDNTSASVTFTGTWSNSSAARFWGAAGSTPYRFTATANTETATAVYTPNIPVAGYYPVYTWVNYGSDRVPGQLYRIRTTGGESQIRVDHRRVGCGWVYLGTHYFEAGANTATGSVVISNQNPPSAPAGSYVAIADAIRFGNGMGDVSNGGGISGYSRREESTVYWIQNGFGNGGDNTIWSNANTADDENLSWSAPPEMAGQMYRVHSDTTTAAKAYALYLGWHSNASGGSARGAVGLITGSPTTNQAWWAAKVCDEIDAASLEEDANWEFTWNDRSSSTYTGGYGEITNGYFASKMDATIIEVAYHDNASDAALLRDPKVRNVHGRAAMRAAVQYFNNFQSGVLSFLPEPPVRLRAVNDSNGGVVLTWAPGPTGGTKGQAATSYRVYRSPDGLGWGAGTPVNATTYTDTGLTPGVTYYYRVAGINAGGESFPTDTLAVRVSAPTVSPKILIVNGYDRVDRNNNVARAGLSSTVEQLIELQNNTHNYTRQHAAAIAAFGMSFDSCENESILSGDVALSKYQVLVWICGEESSADDTFAAAERTAVTNFLNLGNRKLFVSGAEIGFELDSQGVDATFYNTVLAADYGGDDGGSYQATGVAGTIFAGLTINFDASATIYNADYPDRLNAINGSVVCANYSNGGTGGAAVQFTGGSPSRQVVNLGFPFECIGSATTRNQVMNAALTYFGVFEDTPSGGTLTPTPSPSPTVSPTVSPTASPSPTPSPTPGPPTQALVEGFEGYAANAIVLAREPGFSGSSRDIDLATDVSANSTADRNTILDPAVGTVGTASQRLFWSWTAAGTGLARCTSTGAPNRPAPIIHLKRGISIYVRSTQGADVEMSIWVRETGVAGAIGANGGTTGGIEQLANFRRIPAGAGWQYLYFDLPNEPVVAVAGASANNLLEGDWGTLESLVFRPTAAGVPGAVELYIDDVYNGVIHTPQSGVTPVPTLTPAPTATATETPTPSPSLTPTESATPSPTDSLTPTPSPSLTPTESATPSPTDSLTPTPSPSPSVSPTPSDTPTPSPSPTASSTPTLSPTPSPTPLPDQDNDGYSDQYESDNGTDLSDPTSFPLTLDINGDGRVNTVDSLLLYRIVREEGAQAPGIRRPDVNDDGVVDTADAVIFYRWLLGVPGYTVIR